MQVASQERATMLDLQSVERDDVRGLEDFLARQRSLLHPGHAFIMEVDIDHSVQTILSVPRRRST